MNFKMLIAGAAISLTIAGVAGSNAGAAVTYDFTYDLGTQNCATAGGVRTCYEIQYLPAETYGNDGDQYNVDVTVANNHELKLPGSKSRNIIFIEFYDNQYLTSGSQEDTAFATVVPIDYQTLGPPTAPAFPLGYPGVIPLTNTVNHIYAAYSGFCCGYGVPNGGFSVTGADATLTLEDSDPNALSFFVVGTQVAVPEPATWAMLLLGVGMVGAGLRTARRKNVLACGDGLGL